MPSGLPIAGTVSDDEGRPISGAEVAVLDPDQRLVVAEGVTGGDGAYLLSVDEEGEMILRINDPSRRHARVQLPIWVAAAGTRQDITLERAASVAGRVVANTGEPVAGAVVYAAGIEVEVDADGAYELTGLPTGEVTIGVRDTSGRYVLDSEGVRTVSLEAGQQVDFVDVTLTLGAQVSGRITDVTGSGVQGTVSGVSWLTAVVSGSSGAFVFSDADGYYSMTVEPGAYGLVGSALNTAGGSPGQGVFGSGGVPEDGDWSNNDLLGVVAGGVYENVDIVLDPNATIGVTVEDETSGSVIEGVRVQLLPDPLPTDGTPWWQYTRTVDTDPAGQATFYVDDGSYKVLASANQSYESDGYAAEWWNDRDAYSRADSIAASTASPANVTVALGAGIPVEISVVDGTSQAVGTQVQILDQDGNLMEETSTFQDDGSIGDAVTALLPGTYDVSVSRYPYADAVIEDVVVGAPGPVVVDLTLTERGSISGTITDGPGNPVPAWSARATLRTVDGGHVETGYVDNDLGEFTLRPPDGGAYVVQFENNAAAWPYPRLYHQNASSLAGATLVSAGPGVDVTGIDADINDFLASGTISGSVTDPAGAPLDSAAYLTEPGQPPNLCCANGGSWNAGELYLPLSEADVGDRQIFFEWTDGGTNVPLYMSEWYDNAPNQAAATIVALPELGETLDLGQIVLDPVGEIEGNVTNGATYPLGGVTVLVYGPDGFQGAAATDAAGDYWWPATASGDYQVEFRHPDYPTEWWDDAGSQGTATSIPLTPGAVHPNTDAVLGGTLPIPNLVAETACDTNEVSFTGTVDPNGTNLAGYEFVVTVGGVAAESLPVEENVVLGPYPFYTDIAIDLVTSGGTLVHGLDDLDGSHDCGIEVPSCAGLDATLFGTDGDDVLNGTAGVDVIHGLGGNDEIKGFGGADVICGGAGVDLIYAGGGGDTVYAGGGSDTVWGGNGNDTIWLAGGLDTAYGGNGADKIHGGVSADTLRGSAGSDTLWGDAGGDDLRGGDQGDTILGGAGNDDIFGNNGPDILKGGDGADTVNGAAGGDDLRGGNQSDTLNGGSGVDVLFGNAGKDTLNGGGAKVDECWGGSGTDTAKRSCEEWHSIEWGPAMFWPLRAEREVGCTYQSPNCIVNGAPYHAYWAIDVEAPKGANVYSAGSGLVVDLGTSVTECTGSGRGQWVKIKHGDGTFSFYYHLSKVTVADGNRVSPTTKIGEVGNTGWVEPCSFYHLHFQVKNAAGVSLNPGQLGACRGSNYVTYPAYWGANLSWKGLQAYKYHAKSNGVAC